MVFTHMDNMKGVKRPSMLLDPGFCLTLRPMKYEVFYEMYRKAIANTWTVEEVDLSSDLNDITRKLSDAEQHLIGRLVAFFATGDTIVANNLVLALYKHVNSPEARMYLSRQLYEEALHIQLYLELVNTYIEDPQKQADAFSAVEEIPSIRKKAEFCLKWTENVLGLSELRTIEDRRKFLLNLISYACCVEGMFFFAAFAYVYFLRSRGLLHGLASGTNWVFRDESCHMAFGLEVIRTVREEEPELWTKELEDMVVEMIDDAIECEVQFADDMLQYDVIGLSRNDMKQYLEHVADQRFVQLGMAPKYNVSNPFPFMDLQDVQELTNFFERRASAYQVAVGGSVSLDSEF